ncbi:MAG: glycosyltransferase, partial [Armatimonadetes bacterium]|nr:glycosyltransferase [Armatimonadota bacterium]
MRVLFWSELFLPYLGGAEIFAGQLLPALAERGHEFTIVTSHHNFDLPDEDEHQGIPVHRLPFRRALGDVDPDSLMDARQRVNQLLRDCTPDIIHVSGVGPSAVFCLQCIKETAPVLFVSLHHELLPSQTRTRQSVLSRLLARADWVSSVSSNVLEQARVLEPGIRDRSSVIYNFIDATAPPAQPRTLESPVLLCLGRLVPQKGFDVALKAFADVRKRIPAARLVIAGDGEMRGRLEELASDLGLGEGVEFTG